MALGEKEIRQRLESVRKSYSSFIEGTLDFIEEFDIGEDLMSYIDKNPDATASDVIKETHRIVYGVML